MNTAWLKTILRYVVIVIPGVLILIIIGGTITKPSSTHTTTTKNQEATVTAASISLDIDTARPTNSLDGYIPVSIKIDNSSHITKVEYYIDKQLFSSTYTFPYSLILDTKQLQNGKHSITAKVFDISGNSTSAAPIVFTVENPSSTTPATRRAPLQPPLNQSLRQYSLHIVKNAPAPNKSKPSKAPVSDNGPSSPPQIEDTLAPTKPLNVIANAISSYQVDISWDASTDDTGVANYKLYRDNQLLKATTNTSFSDFTVTPGNAYSYTVQALDAANNISPSSSASQVTLDPTSIWMDFDEPATSGTDGSPLELGVKFIPKVSGKINGMKFYKASGDSGEHIASLWRQSDNSLLARGSFTDETSSGWQIMTFDAPIEVDTDETYIASYSTSSGTFSVTHEYFLTRGISSQYITAPATTPAGGNGVYTAAVGTLPTSTYGGNNYWADVTFVPHKDAEGPERRISDTPETYAGFPGELDTGIYGKRLPVRDRAPDFVRPGMVIRGVVFDISSMTISRNNTIFRDVAVRYSGQFNTGFTLIHLPNGVKGTTFEDSEIDGRNAIGRTILGAGNESITVRRSNIHSTGNAIETELDITVENSFIHDIHTPSGLDWHADGIQTGGSSSNNVIRGNTILLNGGETGAINMIGTAGQTFSNILIENNIMAGGGYTVYAGAGTNTNFRIINNKFSTMYQPHVGVYNIYYPNFLNGIDISGNTFYETGAPADTNFNY